VHQLDSRLSFPIIPPIHISITVILNTMLLK